MWIFLENVGTCTCVSVAFGGKGKQERMSLTGYLWNSAQQQETVGICAALFGSAAAICLGLKWELHPGNVPRAWMSKTGCRTGMGESFILTGSFLVYKRTSEVLSALNSPALMIWSFPTPGRETAMQFTSTYNPESVKAMCMLYRGDISLKTS